VRGFAMEGYITFFEPTAPLVIGFHKGKTSIVRGESVQGSFLKHDARYR
jgi:hypothetical protein